MCEPRNTRFFRPWDVDDVSECEEDSSTNKETMDSRMKHELEEDFESVHSNDCDGNHLERSRSSSASSCSVISEDLSETSSLNMLSNFVFNARPENHMNSAAIDNINSAVYAKKYYNQTYPDYIVSLNNGFLPPERPSNVFDVYSPHFHYGLPAIPQEAYANVEEAVKYIQQQDAAVKQMKKLRPKKFKCEHCQVAFSNNGQLKGHIRIHTGERPYKCDTDGCGKSFTRNEELTRHKRIHTGVRPHACLVCGKRFGRKDHLKKHTRTHENRTPYHIPIMNHFALIENPISCGYMF